MMRAILASLLLTSGFAATALAQLRFPGGEAGAPPASREADAAPDASASMSPAAGQGSADYCGFLRNQITQAEQTLRQLVVSINATGRTDPPAQLVTRAAWMDQWAGRLAGYVEATTPANCLSPAQLESARQVVAQYGAFASQARDFALRPTDPAAAAAGGTQQPTAAQRRQQRREQQRREQDFQQSVLP